MTNKKIYFTALILLLGSIVCGPAVAFDIIAHRGLPKYEAEHTEASLKAALLLEPSYVEPDVMLSKDNQFIVHHNLTLNATTNVKDIFPDKDREDGGYYVVDFTLAELERLNFYKPINEKTGKPAIAGRERNLKKPQKVLTLDRFLNIVTDFNKARRKPIGVYPELKDPEFHIKQGYKSIILDFAEKLNTYKISQPKTDIIAQCFHYATSKKLRKLVNKDIKVVQLFAPNSWKISSTDYAALRSEKNLPDLTKSVNGVGLWINEFLSPNKDLTNWLSKLKNSNLLIHVYTVRNDRLPKGFNSELQLIEYLSKYDIDGFFTDSCGESKEVIEKLNI